MAGVFHFDLISPEKRIYSGEASMVVIPGSEGDFGVLPHHAPVATNMRPGILRIITPKGEKELSVTGGFAEISKTGVIVLVDSIVGQAKGKD